MFHKIQFLILKVYTRVKFYYGYFYTAISQTMSPCLSKTVNPRRIYSLILNEGFHEQYI